MESALARLAAALESDILACRKGACVGFGFLDPGAAGPHIPQLLRAAHTDTDLGVRCAATETLKTLARRQKAEAAVDGGAADGAGAAAALPAREPTASTPAGVDAEIAAQL